VAEDDLKARQLALGLSQEDVEKLLVPMALQAKEPVGSMGDDTPLAALSAQPRPLYHFFAQRFAQVTNPPIDPLREKLVMRLDTWLGPRGSLLEAGPAHARLLRLQSPILMPGELDALKGTAAMRVAVVAATWAAGAGAEGLAQRLDQLGAEAVQAVRAGAGVVIVSDRWVSSERAPVPMALALGAVRRALADAGLLLAASLVCEAGDVWEDHSAAVLLGFGAAAVAPYMAVETLAALASSGQVGALAPEAALANFRAAMEAGLRKIMAKMGISAVASYHGAQLFEVLGLADALVAAYFPGAPSRLAGRDLTAIAAQVLVAHTEAFPGSAARLPDRGIYRYRVGGEYHANGPDVFKAIQKLAKSGDAEDTAALAALVGDRPPVSVRDLLRFKPGRSPVPLTEVEGAAAIVRRFVASAMSLGSLSREAHECIAIAMNRLGAKSNSGEGGEDPARFTPRPDGDSANSTIKQVASGRFGVTPAYLMSAEELEIKMAQGAKPGEGGQLPATKVNEEIARLRHATPGMSLISPPPHHDIYSIEDLAQLIHDLRAINPRARVAVKLVSVAGVGTIAAGVAKAHADIIHISGHDGGTGASPLGSIKHAGVPWELGLAEAQQVLVHNDLRGRVTLRADGGLKTGRDVVVAALLGAEEFAFGTALLIAAGCVMIRQCHNNTCPTGIATQDPKLRARFKGTPENVVNYLLGVAEDVRGLLAGLGLHSLDEAVGQVGLLETLPGVAEATGMCLDRVLADPDPSGTRPKRRLAAWAPVPVPSLDAALRDRLEGLIESHGSATLALPIRNVDRTVGARLAGAIAARHGDGGFGGRFDLNFEGSAGQSFGAFCLGGMHLSLTGEANDYVGKGMHGGVIAVQPPSEAAYAPAQNVILGNTVLYGATGGRLFAAGRAGERFAVRNSGAVAVVEGVGDHGCEYMTGGCVLVLGPAGRNFGAGMTGGEAYVLDLSDGFVDRVNTESVRVSPVTDPAERDRVQALVAEHHAWTRSAQAAAMLADWGAHAGRFFKVAPEALPAIAPPAAEAHSTVPASR
jgi:glutamate synthase domain-containing protein 2/glutamate synthase domain-containing protein 3